MNYQLLIPCLLTTIAALAEGIAEIRNKDVVIFRRPVAIITGILILTSILIGASSVDTPMHLVSEISDYPDINLIKGDHLSQHHWGYVFATLQCLLFILGSLLAPRVPLVKVRMSRAYIFMTILLFLSLTNNFTYFMLGMLILYPLLAMSISSHARSLLDDNRKIIRVKTFTRYHTITSLGLLVGLIDHLLVSNPELMVSKIGTIALAIATCSGIGMFPFHSWVLPFMGAPRSTIFLPLFCLQAGLLLLFRLYVPILSMDPVIIKVALVFALIGLVYGTILLFGETKLKRIPGYLYLSHISLMLIGITSLGADGQIASVLDSVNLLISFSGLITVCALLTARFGVKGVLSPQGLVSNFPELGVCYLLCALSLVGFPGTLGFIEEELIIEAGLSQHYVIIGFITVALTLNGFSCFRLFARIFYGYKSDAVDKDMSLSTREKFAICSILIALIVNGLMPNVIFSLLGTLG